MVCLYCHSETIVSNSRPQKRLNSVWRRRACTRCRRLFSTIERVDYEKAWTVHYLNGRQSPFLRDKLFLSLYYSCQHRPSGLREAASLTNTVISSISLSNNSGVIQAHSLAQNTYIILKRFDKAAASHYQAYHNDVLTVKRAKSIAK